MTSKELKYNVLIFYSIFFFNLIIYYSDNISLELGLCRMGILVIVTTTILESFWSIICHKSNFILK
jgi:hypothetical protein